jgi:hypothetical protein
MIKKNEKKTNKKNVEIQELEKHYGIICADK